MGVAFTLRRWATKREGGLGPTFSRSAHSASKVWCCSRWWVSLVLTERAVSRSSRRRIGTETEKFVKGDQLDCLNGWFVGIISNQFF